MLSEPLPPITMSPSMPRSAIVAATSSTPVGVSKGLPRFVPSTVPPRGSVPRIVSTVSGIVRRSRTPSHASRKPISSSPWVRSPSRTMARMHRVQSWAVAATGEHADTHRRERTTRCRAPLAIAQRRANNRRRGMGRQPAGALAPVDPGVADLRRDHDRRVRPADPRRGRGRSSAGCWPAGRCTSPSGTSSPSSATSARRWPRCARRAPAAATVTASEPRCPPATGSDPAHLHRTEPPGSEVEEAMTSKR